VSVGPREQQKERNMEIRNKIDFQSFARTHRQFYSMQELVNTMRRNQIVWSWGASAWTKMNDQCLRFMVRGHQHQGHVYLAINGGDLFDIYLTTSQGLIKHIITDVFINELIDVIDRKVERIDTYVQ
jgi:hypothetical protein